MSGTAWGRVRAYPMSDTVRNREPGAPGPTRVLVVDDSDAAGSAARRALEGAGFEVSDAGDGDDALKVAGSEPPDLILLDLGMPGMGGLEVLSEIRRTSALPIIVLSGRAEESERVVAFEMGADDYIVKPFLVRELPARIRSVLRRARPAAPAALDFGGLEIRTAEREVLVRGERVDTTAKEFDLLARLASEPRRVFSRSQLLEEVWDSSRDWQDPATVTEHIRRLRRKIEDDPEQPRWLHTVRGVGYRFEP
jgi:DNA-binding response OmpR family regulator